MAAGAAVFATLAVSACSAERSTEPEPAPGQPGTFTLHLSGAATRTVDGQHARFTTDLAESGIGTAVHLRDGSSQAESRHALYLYRASVAPLAPGEYPIVANDEHASREDFVGGIGLDTGPGRDSRACVALTGSLHVTSADGDRITATLHFTGLCLSAGTSELTPVEVAGAFSARQGALGS